MVFCSTKATMGMSLSALMSPSLPYMPRPRVKGARELKEEPMEFRNFKIISGSWPPNEKFETIPNMVMDTEIENKCELVPTVIANSPTGLRIRPLTTTRKVDKAPIKPLLLFPALLSLSVSIIEKPT